MEIVVESVNTILLAAGLSLMHRGIEIGHPVYGILFCDLVTTFFSSLLNAWIIPFIALPPYDHLTNVNNLTCLLLHCCFWCVLSVLRYMYIIKKTWLEMRFPKNGTLLFLSLLSAISLYFLCASSMLGTALFFGFPEKKIMALPLQQRLICAIVYLANYAALTLASCVFYTLILRKRGGLGNNRVKSLQMRSKHKKNNKNPQLYPYRASP